MKCVKCYKELTEDQDRSSLLLMNVESSYYKELFKEGEGGLHQDCAEAVIREEKLQHYKEILKPVFDKLNRNQFKLYDTEAIVSAFFCQHRFLQSEAIMVLKAIIERIGTKAGDPGYIDPRNEWAVAWCKKVSNL